MARDLARRQDQPEGGMGDGSFEQPEVEIRIVRPAELDETADLIVQAFAEFESLIRPGLWSCLVQDWRDIRGRLGVSELIVASARGGLVGAVTFYPDASRSGSERWPAHWASIRAMVVRPDWRGRGIGRRLTEECLRRAGESGHRTVGLHTAPFLTAAIAMYRRLGFRRDPAHDVGWLGVGSVPVGSPGSLHAFAFRHDLAGQPRGARDG